MKFRVEEFYFSWNTKQTELPSSRMTWRFGDSDFMRWYFRAQFLLFRSPPKFSTLGLAVLKNDILLHQPRSHSREELHSKWQKGNTNIVEISWYCIHIRTRQGIYGKIYAFEKGDIWPNILSWVLIRKYIILTIIRLIITLLLSLQ